MILFFLGLTIVVVALFCITTAELLAGHPIFEEHRLTLAAALGGGGLLVLLVGIIASHRRRNMKLPPPGPLAQMFELRYWGTMALVLAAITFYFEAWDVAGRWHQLRAELTGAPEIVLAREPDGTNLVAAPPPPPPAVFPTVKLQGILYKKDRPVAFINGEPYGVGDHVGDALVKEVTREGLILQIGTEEKFIRLGGRR